MQLSDMKVGQTARIIAFNSSQKSDKSYRKRLIDMGFLPGTVLTLIRIAPLGDPIEIRIRDIALSVRKEEAALLQLSLVRP
jgi:ferrous iron transport protein A